MKLRNLFLSTLVVCAFSACTKDDDGIQVPVEPVDASISFATTTLTQTKAVSDTEGKTKDTFVNELYAFIFKVPADESNVANMTLVGWGKADTKDGQSVTTINHIIIKVTPNSTDETKASADVFKAVLVANPGKSFSTSYASLAALQEATLTNSIETYPFSKSPYLPMVSEVIDVKNIVPIIKGENGTTYNENWISGDGKTVTKPSADDSNITKPQDAGTIELIRLVARVQVEQIKSSIHDAYPGSSFELTNLSLVNVRPLATMENGIGSTYEFVKGFESKNYQAVDKWIYPDFTGGLINADYETALSQKCNVVFSNEKESWTPKENKFYSYAFPNSSGGFQTALLITGIFKRNATDRDGEVKNFRVILKDNEVIRNNVYKLIITLTGEGSSNEDKIELNAHVSAQIEVANWFVVDQTETDVN